MSYRETNGKSAFDGTANIAFEQEQRWMRWPKGWIVLSLAVLAWLAIFLIWQGVALLVSL